MSQAFRQGASKRRGSCPNEPSIQTRISEGKRVMSKRAWHSDKVQQKEGGAVRMRVAFKQKSAKESK